jgi:hypothetical protein
MSAVVSAYPIQYSIIVRTRLLDHGHFSGFSGCVNSTRIDQVTQDCSGKTEESEMRIIVRDILPIYFMQISCKLI